MLRPLSISAQLGVLTLEVLDVLAGEDHGGVLYIHRRKREATSLEARICVIATTVRGQLVEVWEHIYDPPAFDSFYTQT